MPEPPLPKGAKFIDDGPPLPPGATYLEDTQASAPVASAPRAEMSAGQPQPWIDQLEEDLREGGGRTAVGRGLGYLQGRGGQGYSGMGEGPNGAQSMPASLVMGPVHMAQGIHEIPSHPGAGLLKAGAGALEASQIPLSFMAPEASEGLINKIPSRPYARQLFETVMRDAGNQPVNLEQSGEPLVRAWEMGEHGATRPKAVTQLFKRVTDPEAKPLTYQEARDFAHNLSELSSEEKSSLKPVMRRQVGQVSHTFNADVGKAAEAGGRGAEYQQAMREYRNASRLRDLAGKAFKWGAIGFPAGIATDYAIHKVTGR